MNNLSVGSHTLKAVYGTTESNTISVSVGKISTQTSISASSSSVTTLGTLTLSGSITGATSGTVKIYEGNTVVADNVTVSSGSWSKSLTGLTAGSHTYYAEFQSDSTHNSSQSSTVTDRKSVV